MGMTEREKLVASRPRGSAVRVLDAGEVSQGVEEFGLWMMRRTEVIS
jgi:hypothetical protein